MKAYIVKSKSGEYLTLLDQAVIFTKDPEPWSIEFWNSKKSIKEFMQLYSPLTEFDILEVNIP